MSSKIPRVRMFAGPNGSGKSCFNHIVNPKWLGVYVNADVIEKELLQDGIQLSEFKVGLDDHSFLQRFHDLCKIRNMVLPDIECDGGKVTAKSEDVNSYYAAMIAELIRMYLLDHKISFTFETVMSHESKIEFLQLAHDRGFRTYLYFIATKDPKINIARVAKRVLKGGHNVPENKIVNRYHRAISMLPMALAIVDRGFVFDNSGDKEEWVAETSASGLDRKITLGLKVEIVPYWMESVIKLK